MQIRSGRLIGKKDFEYQYDDTTTSQEILLSFLREYYELNNEIVTEIVIDTELTKEDTEIYTTWLSSKAHFNVKLRVPKNKKNRELMELAKKNAGVYLDKINLQRQSQIQNDYNKVGLHIKEKLRLKTFPHRVECFDISHIQGTNTVASMVMFENGVPKKSEYRKFKIKTVEEGKPDDFKSLQEVVKRRYQRLINENKTLPDLIIIDGGKGQLSSVCEIMKELNLEHQDIVSLAKKLEEVFLPNRKLPVVFERDSGALYFFQQIRDEAHRFAITFHRKLREKSALNSIKKSTTKKQS